MLLYDGTVTEEESGLFKIKDYPYNMAAWPDRLLGDSILLEVKCPYTARNQTINPYTDLYLQYGDGNALIWNVKGPLTYL